MQSEAIARELEPEVERLLARHDSTAVEWFPHEYVPWGRARDFVSREEWWDPEDHEESAARSALFVNLLTEDNLPYYFRTLSDFGRDGVWGEWTRRWTAEEGRHAIVIRDYLMVTRAVDPVSLERGRMQQVSTGVTPQPASLCDALCYTSLQELATRIAHRNTGKVLEDPAGQAIMARVSNGREPALPLLPGSRVDRDRDGPVRDGRRDGPDRPRVHDARHRHPGLRAATRG